MKFRVTTLMWTSSNRFYLFITACQSAASIMFNCIPLCFMQVQRCHHLVPCPLALSGNPRGPITRHPWSGHPRGPLPQPPDMSQLSLVALSPTAKMPGMLPRPTAEMLRMLPGPTGFFVQARGAYQGARWSALHRGDGNVAMKT